MTEDFLPRSFGPPFFRTQTFSTRLHFQDFYPAHRHENDAAGSLRPLSSTALDWDLRAELSRLK